MCLAIAAAAVPLAAAALAKPAAALTLTAAAIFVRSKLAGVLINLFKANSAVSGSVRVQTIGKAFGSGSLICTNTGAGMAPRSASGSHCWDNLNDGLYGNSKSWIPRVGGDKAGVVLPAAQTIVGIQLARGIWAARAGVTPIEPVVRSRWSTARRRTVTRTRGRAARAGCLPAGSAAGLQTRETTTSSALLW